MIKSIYITSLLMKENAPWEIASKECRNAWHEAGDKDFINKPPIKLNDWRDAYLAGMAEEMASVMGWDIPAWCEQPHRFLKKAMFINCPTPLTRSLALTETAIGFRRRNIFVLIDIRQAKSGRFSS